MSKLTNAAELMPQALPRQVRIPSALKRDTIVECVLEIRYEPASQSSVELLPGLIIGQIGDLFQGGISRTPLGSLPTGLPMPGEMLDYQPIHVLSGDGYQMMLSRKGAALAFINPYPGWATVLPIVMRCLAAFLQSKQIKQVERLAIKYTNLLDVGDSPDDLKQLHVQLDFGGFPMRGPGRALQAELDCDGCTCIVQVAADVTINFTRPGSDSGQGRGVLLSLDVIKVGPFPDFADQMDGLVNGIHDVEKKLFFGLVTDETVQKLGPIYA